MPTVPDPLPTKVVGVKADAQGDNFDASSEAWVVPDRFEADTKGSWGRRDVGCPELPSGLKSRNWGGTLDLESPTPVTLSCPRSFCGENGEILVAGVS